MRPLQRPPIPTAHNDQFPYWSSPALTQPPLPDFVASSPSRNRKVPLLPTLYARAQVPCLGWLFSESVSASPRYVIDRNAVPRDVLIHYFCELFLSSKFIHFS